MSLRRGDNPKLELTEEQAHLDDLREKREKAARIRLQAEVQSLARKLNGQGSADISSLADEAAKLVAKDKKNFGDAPQIATVAITLNAVFLSASAIKSEDANGKKGGRGKGGGKGGGYAKAGAKPKIGAKIEKLPPPSVENANAMIVAHKATLAKVSKFEEGQLAILQAFESWIASEYNEPLLPHAPALLETLYEEELVEKDVLIGYWENIQARCKKDTAELLVAQELTAQAELNVEATNAQMDGATEQDVDAAKQLKAWGAEMQAARTGNNPTADEAVREQTAIAENNKALAAKNKCQKLVEGCRKKQVTDNNARDALKKALQERTQEAQPSMLIHQHLHSFLEKFVASPAEAPAKDDAAAAA